MSDEKPSFFSRIFLAWAAYFRTLFDADFASGVIRLRHVGALPASTRSASDAPERLPSERQPKPSSQPPAILKAAAPDAALWLLSLLQREGRFVDFVFENIAGASDADLGAAARVVHAGCKKALAEHFTIDPVQSAEEGARITVPAGFDARAIRVTGSVVGEAPYSGALTHRGWRCTNVRLPKTSEQHDPSVIAPAEVELP